MIIGEFASLLFNTHVIHNYFFNHKAECYQKNAFVLVQQTSYQKVVGLYTLKCETNSIKVTYKYS